MGWVRRNIEVWLRTECDGEELYEGYFEKVLHYLEVCDYRNPEDTDGLEITLYDYERIRGT